MSTLAVAAIAVALWGWLRPGPPKAVTSRYGLSFPRDDQAIAEAKRAQLLDPVSAEATNIVGLNLVLARRYDEAIPWLRMAIDLDPTYFPPRDRPRRPVPASGNSVRAGWPRSTSPRT